MVYLIPTIETERLTLREFRDSDLDAYTEMISDPEVMRYINGGQDTDREEAWRHLAMLSGHWNLKGYGMWAVCERGSEELIGRLGFLNPEGWLHFELGWMLTQEHWGKGYATEGARAALKFAFTELGRDDVASIIRPGNAASIRVAERIGETLDGTVMHKDEEALLYRIDRKDWMQLSSFANGE